MVYEGHGFESTSWFWGDIGLSLEVCFLGVVGFNPHLCFLGAGGDFFCLDDGGGFTLIFRGLFF